MRENGNFKRDRNVCEHKPPFHLWMRTYRLFLSVVNVIIWAFRFSHPISLPPLCVTPHPAPPRIERKTYRLYSQIHIYTTSHIQQQQQREQRNLHKNRLPQRQPKIQELEHTHEHIFYTFTTYHHIYLHVPRNTLHIIYENNPNRILQRMVINCALFLPLRSNIIRKSLLVYYPPPPPLSPLPTTVAITRTISVPFSLSLSLPLYLSLSNQHIFLFSLVQHK